MALLDLLGITIPGLKGENTPGGMNPFSGLVGGGMPHPPTEVGTGFNALIPTLVQALTGKLVDPAQAAPVAPTVTGMEANTGQVPSNANPVAPPTARPLPPEYAERGITPAQWNEMNKPDEAPQPAQSAVKPTATTYIPTQGEPANWPSIRAGIFKGESGGDPNALFGFSNREGGKWAGTRLTDMTVDQAIEFSDPKGPYAQWVKGQIGRVATPMGTYQIVGTTLRGVKQGMGLSGTERMTPELQEEMGKYIYKTQGTGAWAGYRGPADPASMPFPPPSSGPAYGPTSNEMTRPSGSRSAIPAIAGTAQTGAPGLNMPKGEFNTALAGTQASSRRRGGGGGAGGPEDPGSAGGGGARKNDLSPDYKRYQARKNIRHLRGMSPVATIQALENIGKGLRTQGGGRQA